MDRLNAMQAFARVAELGSFSAAARQLGLAKSVVSKLVMGLENHLGARLLNRTTRRLSLTEAGVTYYEACARILGAVEEADLSVSRLQAIPRGRLKVNASMSFGFLHLAPAIPDFLARYPELQIDLTLNDRFVDLVDGGYDVAVRIGALADSSLIARKLAPARRIVCGSPDYFARHGVPQLPEDLADHNCLGYSYQVSGNEWPFRGPEREHRVKVSGSFEVNNGDALRAAAIGGLGIVLLPSFIIGDDLAAGRLRCVLSAYRAPETDIHAVYPHSRHLSAKVRAFVDFLAERFGPQPYWDKALPAPDGKSSSARPQAPKQQRSGGHTRAQEGEGAEP
ncbi:LysR family transcriptional regulator [Rhodospirillaceae bacterium SYSU D60014]|uniref:LysR family transcriptional regulator n=1 Tax=Virgifigura deserti TaxID=2268457 RepID=UPI000E67218F